jgi:hypothetical protein
MEERAWGGGGVQPLQFVKMQTLEHIGLFALEPYQLNLCQTLPVGESGGGGGGCELFN